MVMRVHLSQWRRCAGLAERATELSLLADPGRVEGVFDMGREGKEYGGKIRKPPA